MPYRECCEKVELLVCKIAKKVDVVFIEAQYKHIFLNIIVSPRSERWGLVALDIRSGEWTRFAACTAHITREKYF